VSFLVHNAYGRGGTARTTLNTAGALAERGHDVEVVSVFRHRAAPAFEVPPGVRLRPLLGQRGPRSWRDLPRTAVRSLVRTVTRRFRSRLIHPEDPRHATYSLWHDLVLIRYLRAQREGVLLGTTPGLNLAVARWARPGVVTIGQEHLHLHRHGPGLQAAFRQHYPRLDAVVTLTQRDAGSYRALLADRNRVRVIPNAVPDLGQVPRVAGPRDRFAVAAGRLTRQKGFDVLVRAWRPVARSHPEWTLHIYGEGAERERLQALIDRCGLGRQVQLKGFTPRLPDALARSSLFVLSSRFEGLPMVLLEAMRCGVTVVAVDCPTGPADLIDPGVDGLLVRPLSARALSHAIQWAIAHPRARRRLAAAGQARSLCYARELIAARWEQLFAECQRDLPMRRHRGRRSA